MIPRIQGRVGQAESPEDIKGKWFFEIFLSEMGEGEGKSMGTFGPYENRDIAMSALKEACKMACECLEKNVMGKVSGKYIDMKTNEMRNWDEH